LAANKASLVAENHVSNSAKKESMNIRESSKPSYRLDIDNESLQICDMILEGGVCLKEGNNHFFFRFWGLV
jgi:hypothetical protein